MPGMKTVAVAPRHSLIAYRERTVDDGFAATGDVVALGERARAAHADLAAARGRLADAEAAAMAASERAVEEAAVTIAAGGVVEHSSMVTSAQAAVERARLEVAGHERLAGQLSAQARSARAVEAARLTGLLEEHRRELDQTIDRLLERLADVFDTAAAVHVLVELLQSEQGRFQWCSSSSPQPLTGGPVTGAHELVWLLNRLEAARHPHVIRKDRPVPAGAPVPRPRPVMRAIAEPTEQALQEARERKASRELAVKRARELEAARAGTGGGSDA